MLSLMASDARSDPDSTLVGEARHVSETATFGADKPPGQFSDIEGERLFALVRGRMFARDSALEIGRYRIEERLGAGGMGEVHRGRDKELDRPVAIKFVHAHLTSRRWAEGLRMEARALARLAHPNVVHVYEIGDYAGRVFLAMEFIDGGNLREWIAEDSPSWTAVLDAYVAAGRGLAAAHGAGVIHRDFKPDNVLRGTDGRVAVVDFGLAAVELGADYPSDRAAQTEPDTLTSRDRTTEIKGTPSYMAPEQFHGRGDARVDQFGWCVALYEGLWGRRPFPRRSIELQAAELDWTPLRPPSKSKVPSWLWPILRRGLAVEPGDRWADMDELLAAIERGLARHRQRARRLGVGAAIVAVGLLSGAAAAWWSEPAAVDACASLDDELADTWDPARAERLRERFRETAASPGASWLVDSSAPVIAGLDRFRERWIGQRAELCRARARGGDPVVLDRLGACLERQRLATRGIVELLLAGDLDTLREAPRAISQLDDPAVCVREARQGGPPEPPPAIVDEVAAVRSELALVEAELSLGREEQALGRLSDVEPEVRRLEHRPLTAELELLRGRALLASAQPEGFEVLEQAADLGEAGRHDRVVAQSWRWMAMVAATELPDLERGRRWLRRAEAALARLGEDELGEARLAYVRGSLDLLGKDREAGIAQLELALARFEALDDLLYASYAASALGVAQLDAGDERRAVELLELALERREQALGPRHPDVAYAAVNLGELAFAAGRVELARSLLERGVEIWTRNDSPSQRDLARAQLVLAQLALAEGQAAPAIEHAKAAADGFEQSLPANDVAHADAAGILANSHYFLREPEPAIDAYRRAIAGYTETYGAGDLYTALFRVGLGWALLAVERSAEAREEFAAGLAAIEAAAGLGAAAGVDARFGLIAVDLADGRLDEARRKLASFEVDALGRDSMGGMELLEFDLFRGIALVRHDPDDPAGPAALVAARARSESVDHGPNTLLLLLDSVRASADERRLLGE